MKLTAAQNRKLREWADLISPWMFALPQHVARRQARLLRGWGECAAKKASGQ